MKTIIKLSLALSAIVAAVFVMSAWGTVSAGQRGVVVRMGRVTGEIKGEGIFAKSPLDSIVSMDVRQQKEQVETECASKELQTVHATIALNLNLDPNRCAWVYQKIGKDYLAVSVAPAMQESIKAIIAQYTAEELISKREVVREAIASLMSGKLAPMGVHTEALNIVNFSFSASFNTAIESKVTAEQNALAAKNLLAQKTYEAQQAVATAKGRAEAMQIESAVLVKNPQILQLRALEKWDGMLPRVSSGAMPFIDVKAFADAK